MESPQSLLAAIAAALRAAGMHDEASRVEADSVTVEHDRDAAVVLWQWLADAPKDMPVLGATTNWSAPTETGLEAVTRPLSKRRLHPA